jgi:ABC-type multidrug transport system, ATPase component
MVILESQGLRLAYRDHVVLDDLDLCLEEGRVLGLIGPNGAGKTSLFNALLGFIPHEGRLSVLGCDPWRARDRVMAETAFVSDVAVLPRWLRVDQAIAFTAGVQPRFDRAKAEAFLERTTIPRQAKVHTLSKGMVTQLHLALAMAIDARLLVLDEPTLGLDLITRKAFYDALLGEFCDDGRSVVVATHEVEEIQHVLTDFVFLAHGRAVATASMADYETRFVELRTGPADAAAARALHPVSERDVLGRRVFLFDGVDRQKLEELGETASPSLADLFLAVMGTEAAA